MPCLHFSVFVPLQKQRLRNLCVITQKRSFIHTNIHIYIFFYVISRDRNNYFENLLNIDILISLWGSENNRLNVLKNIRSCKFSLMFYIGCKNTA